MAEKSGNQNDEVGGRLEIHAVLGSALETMTRYQAAVKRDLYRAMETLRKFQAERHDQ